MSKILSLLSVLAFSRAIGDVFVKIKQWVYKLTQYTITQWVYKLNQSMLQARVEHTTFCVRGGFATTRPQRLIKNRYK